MNIFGALFAAYWWMIPIIVVVRYCGTPAGKGFIGELFVNISAKLMLNSSVYHVFRDVTLPSEGGTTQIDHIVVSKFGVFVLETKNFAGWIFGGPRQTMWTQKFPRSSRKFQNPLHQNYKHTRTLADLLGLEDVAIHSLIVFVGDSVFKTAMPENVTQAGGYIRFIKSKTTQLLSDEQVATIIEQIRTGRLNPSLHTSQQHAQHVKRIVGKKTAAILHVVDEPTIKPSSTDQTCPKCGEDLVPRTYMTGPSAGSTFTGCSAFPSCRFIRRV